MLRLGVSTDQYNLGGSRVYESTAASAEWRHSFNKQNQVNLLGQASRFRFPSESLQIQNFDQSVFGAGAMHVLADGKSTIFANVLTGYERSVAPVTEALAMRLLGIPVRAPGGGDAEDEAVAARVFDAMEQVP